MTQLIRRTITLWTAWRARRRLHSIAGWQEAHDATKLARARHGRSMAGIKAMQKALHDNMRGE